MRLDTSQQLRMSQEMKLAPRIIQMMEILQLPMLALQERIDAELVSNPVLELEEPGADEPADTQDTGDNEWGERDLAVADDANGADDFARLDDMTGEYGEDFTNGDARSGSYEPGERDAKLDAMANTAAPDESLTDHLLDQWAFVEVSDAIRAAGRRIIEHVDADGYLRTSLEDLARGDDEEPPMDLATLTDALWRVQELEPVGVGARNLRECLLLQLGAQAAAGHAAEVALPMRIVKDFLREVEANQLPVVAKRTGRGIEEVKQALVLLSRLDAAPGRQIASQTAPVITPDVIVTLDRDGEPVVRMTDAGLPALAVNADYVRQSRDRGTDAGTRKFLQRNLRSAEWLIDAIAQRRHTIRRVAEEVFKVQKDFLTQGREALKPLPMADVAEKVGVHVATVSRAVADKYAETPQGIVPLRMFFSGGTTTADGQDMSWDAVKVKLREIVDREDKANPLNDDELVDALKADGIDIKRRTVAKYRSLLDIPTARKRRQY